MTTDTRLERKRLEAILKDTQSHPPEHLSSVMVALANTVLELGREPEHREAYESIMHSAKVVSYMHGLTADFEWAKLSTLERLRLRLRDGVKREAWEKARTAVLLREGLELAWPTQRL